MTTRKWVFSVLAVLLGWITLQLSVMRFTDAAPGAIALFPTAGFTSRLSDGMAVVGSGQNWIAVKSEASGLGRDLYAAGAWIVLPAGLPGCLPLS